MDISVNGLHQPYGGQERLHQDADHQRHTDKQPHIQLHLQTEPHTVLGWWRQLFNASQRTPFQLFRNGELIEDGYMKLDNIIKDGYKVIYQITLYGGLSQFYNLTYSETGRRTRSVPFRNLRSWTAMTRVFLSR